MQKELIFQPSKEQKENIKQDLINRVKYLRQHKDLLKRKQREKSKFERDSDTWRVFKTPDSSQWLVLAKNEYEQLKTLNELKDAYRIRHIVYSMMRGKTIQQIEPKTKKEREWQKVYIYGKAKDMLYSLGLNWIE